jgi:phosphohistidine phosphatase
MQLLVVRHAIAVDQEEWQGDDAQRPLTDEGRKKMKRVAQGLRRLVDDLGLLAASPLVRAQQTAQILAAAYDDVAITTVPTLAPGQSPGAVARWLQDTRRDTVTIVGHEPGLSNIVSWLVAGGDRSFLELKKGGACMVEVPREAGRGSGMLVWALWPSHLRDLGD